MEQRHPNHPGEMGTDEALAEVKRERGELHARAEAVQRLTEARVPFVVGGAYAYAHYTGIYRDTKDLDLFPRRADAPRALEVLAADGWRTERTDEVWLYKAFKGEWFVDLIFSSGNGVAEVDDEWFTHAHRGEVFGQPVLIAPAEEMIWSKAFVLERERYDGSDVNHLLRAAGTEMDWRRVLRRFDRHWEVLLAHLQLFRFAYPSDRSVVPRWLMVELLTRALQSVRDGDWEGRMCRGNLLSRVNYQVDITQWGYQDGRRWDEHARSEREGAPGGSG
ncbi:MAG TPA: nucleotidyltransferase family protein [Myxococcales bacterium]|jgi:hypothetical protein|nr:nucleotidyltransferase family protein [Myxococcales bacterium]